MKRQFSFFFSFCGNEVFLIFFFFFLFLGRPENIQEKLTGILVVLKLPQ